MDANARLFTHLLGNNFLVLDKLGDHTDSNGLSLAVLLATRLISACLGRSATYLVTQGESSHLLRVGERFTANLSSRRGDLYSGNNSHTLAGEGGRLLAATTGAGFELQR